VGDARLTAGRIFLNVGGRQWCHRFPSGGDRVPHHSTMMDVDFLAAALVIVGGSYIALEFGQMSGASAAR